MSDNTEQGRTIDPTLSTAALAGLEATINKALQYDPGTRAALKKLQGQVLAVQSTAPAFTFYLQTCDDDLEVLRLFSDHGQQCSPSTHLRGPLTAIATLAVTDNTTLANSGVEVMGSTALLSDLQKALGQVDIDWEDALNQLLGELPGHQTAEHIRKVARWTQQRASSGQRLLSEFLTEELKSLPSKPELKRFYNAVDDARMQLDRLEQKLEKAIKKIQPGNLNSD